MRTRPRPSPRLLRAWPLLLAQLAACTVGRSVLAPLDDVTDADVAADASPDVALDAPIDTAPDAPPDVAHDAAPDAAIDSALDAAPDATPDVAADAPPDAALDTAPDVARDAAPDAPPDAPADALADAAPDAPRDAPADAAPDAMVCPLGQALCGGACVNTLTHRSHCGACNNACPAGQDCVGGMCACVGLGLTPCGTACVNLASDSLHCGACGRSCPSGQVCRNGTCQMTCASGETLCGTQCVTLGDNVNHCGACNNRCAGDQICASGACVTVVSIDPVGCADGTREGLTNRTMFPSIAACSGAWRQPGIFPAIPASTAAACATLGNSSTTAPADGAGCSAANLCARGWRICNGGDILRRTGSMGCAAGDFPANTFYAAAVSGTGCGRCALRTGTVTGSACSSTSCTANCRESGDLNNDFFGCGTLGDLAAAGCDGLTRFSGNNCSSLSSAWSCGGETMESRTVTKLNAANGGVLCCRD